MRYMMIQFLRKPGGQIDEQVGFSKKLKQADLQVSNIILDYKERKVVKCFIEGKTNPTTFDSMNAYYKEIYPTLVAELEKINTP